jgi:hypothetical protein
MKHGLIALGTLLVILCLPGGALAQTQMQPYYGSPPTVAGGPVNKIPVDTTHPLPVQLQSGIPLSAVQITASATGTTAATTATLAAVSGKTTFICQFTITSTANAGITGTATVTGPITGTLSFVQAVGTSPAVATLTVPFSPCIAASAANTAINVVSVAASTGGVTAVVASGYQQ